MERATKKKDVEEDVTELASEVAVESDESQRCENTRKHWGKQ